MPGGPAAGVRRSVQVADWSRMPQFGAYESVREIYQGGPGAVYAARAAGASEARVAVKAFQPPPWLADEERVELEAALFLEAAELQARIAKGGSAHWAPVHASARCEGGAWYATDLFDRSAEKLVLQRRELDARELHRIIETVVGALVDLKKQHSRPHGNLKPSNVLVSGRGESSKIALSDPLPGARVRAEEDFASDLRGVGDLIHQLVLHKPMRSATAWPALGGPEWQRLGKSGEHWLALCNHLLEPTGKLPEIDEVARALGALKTLGQAVSKESLLHSTASMRSVSSASSAGAVSNDSWVEAVDGAAAPGKTAARQPKSRSGLVGMALALVVIGGGAAYFLFNREEPTTVATSGAKPAPTPGPVAPKPADGDDTSSSDAPDANAEAVAAAERERLEAARKAQAEVEAQKRVEGKLLAATEKAQGIAKLIDQGYGVSDAAPDGKSVGQQYNELADDPDYPRLLAVSPLIAEIDARVRGLRTIVSTSDVDLLVSQAEGGKLTEAITAWIELSDPSQVAWPTSAPQLVKAGLVLSRIKGLAASAGDRGAQLVPIAAERGAAIFKSAVGRLSFESESDIDSLRVAIVAFGAPIASLDPVWRFNIAFRTFRADLAGLANAPEDEVRTRIGAFLNEVGALGDRVTGRPEVAGLLRDLSALATKAAPAAQPATDGGPGKVGWVSSRRDVNGTPVTTFRPAEGAEPAIEFAPVNVGGRTVMLCTTEVSIAMVNAAIERAAGLLSQAGAANSTSWSGPRPWRLGSRKIDLPAANENAASLNWLAIRPQTAGLVLYPSELQSLIQPPTAAHPFNFVSPEAAIKIADALGCRLPSAAEWEAAAKLEPNAPANRRDATWAAQHRHVQSIAKADAKNMLWPDEGAFRSLTASAPRGPNAKPAITEDDRALWFVPVGEGGGTVFHHLVGNVSEIVTDSALGVAVIGASALSPVEMEPAVPQKFGLKNFVADVGFRLAFDAAAPAPVVVANGADLIRSASETAARGAYLKK